ncbi:MAG: hypothetical protein CM1200mP2_36910 [Planctomycetaceae bacterium]|nr:MAG: hypothetical protein CM1200mP2_36910 [Planctomycetaceae bacterium]
MLPSDPGRRASPRKKDMGPGVVLHEIFSAGQFRVFFCGTIGRLGKHQVTTPAPDDEAVIRGGNARCRIAEHASSPNRLARLEIQAIKPSPAPVDVSLVDHRRAETRSKWLLPDLFGARAGHVNPRGRILVVLGGNDDRVLDTVGVATLLAKSVTQGNSASVSPSWPRSNRAPADCGLSGPPRRATPPRPWEPVHRCGRRDPWIRRPKGVCRSLWRTPSGSPHHPPPPQSPSRRVTAERRVPVVAQGPSPHLGTLWHPVAS